jgi:hypothetical protein
MEAYIEKAVHTFFAVGAVEITWSLISYFIRAGGSKEGDA